MSNKNNTKRQYAREQYILGCDFDGKGEIEKAIKHWSNVKRDDDKKAYAHAQFSLGVCFDDKGDLDNAIKHYSNVERDDDKQTYARAQFNLGLCFKDKGELDKAIKHWSNIQRDDDKQFYARAQYNLGVYFDNKGDVDKAIEHWGNIQRDDNKSQYARAQCNLAAYSNNNGAVDKAIDYWGNIQSGDDKEAYARAQFYLGAYFDNKGDPESAIKHWGKIQRDDDEYYEAQYELFTLFLNTGNVASLKQIQENIDSIETHTTQDYINKKIINLLVKVNTEEAKSLNDNIHDLSISVKNITQKLMLKKSNFVNNNPEEKVSTYTSTEVAKIFINNEESSFQLNIYSNMNDKTEGKILNKFIKSNDNIVLDDRDDNSALGDIYALLTSFTFNHNSLNHFRLYGKNNGAEGSGVSFVVNTKMFSDKDLYNHISINNDRIINIENNENKKSSNVDKKIPIYRCIYLDPSNGYLSVAKRSKYSFFLEKQNCDNLNKENVDFIEYDKVIQDIEKFISDELEKVKKTYQEFNFDQLEPKSKSELENIIDLILLPIRFLTKHASFEEEAECRILYIKNINDGKVEYGNNRIYVPYDVPVINDGKHSYLEKIYLGPHVHNLAGLGLKHCYVKRVPNHGEEKKGLIIVKSNLPLA